MQDEVTVSQADERAVAEFHRQSFETLFATTDADIDAGINRAHTLLCQAFARHRHQAERETLARMEWRDIESAPKDGTRFLAWCPYVGRVIMRIDGVHRETWAIDPSGRLGCNPTKWMPLPPAPEAGQ